MKYRKYKHKNIDTMNKYYYMAWCYEEEFAKRLTKSLNIVRWIKSNL